MNPWEVTREYINAGWDAPFPLPAGKKFPPPDGFTGYEGRYPTNEDVDRWIEQRRYGNFGLRAPQGVIGIDWDSYKGHDLYDWVKPYIADAPRSTSKGGEEKSAIYWLGVDPAFLEDLRDRHFAEAGTEVIRPQHRYAVVWPSVHPDTGSTYEWYAGGSTVRCNGWVPNVEDLPYIPSHVLEAVMAKYGASSGRRTGKSSGMSGSGQLRPNVELSELGTIKSLLAGYQTYEIDPDLSMVAARRSWENERIDSIINELDELVGGADAWESTVGTTAFKLISLALAPWSQTELADVAALVRVYGPTCQKARDRGVHDHRGPCWTETDNEARAERSISQHDGGWTQLPPALRGSTVPNVSQPADVLHSEPANVTSLTSADDDDFFDEDVPVQRDPSSLFLRLDRALTRQSRPRPIMGGIFYQGVFNIISGRGGLGKSTAAQAICANHGPTLWLSTEESWGAVHDRALVLGYEDFYAPNEPLTVLDSPVVFDWLATMPDVRTVVIDNLQAFFKLGSESNNNTVVRDAFLEFYRQAEALRMTVIGVSHPPKSGATAVQGSAAWEEVSRHVLKMQELDEEGYRGLALTVAKTNLHTKAYDTWPVTIETVEIPIPSADGTIETTSRAKFPDSEVLRELLRGYMGGHVADAKAKADHRANARHRPVELPEVDDLDQLVTEHWVEPAIIAARWDIPLNKVRALATHHDLMMLDAAGGRLVWIVAEGDVPTGLGDVPLGTFPVDQLLRDLYVTQTTHLTWLISAAGYHADYRDSTVTITNPERDEVDQALRDAGLEEL